ncbi:LacI family DNA-binding transcriptional regulator [Bacillus cereus]
MVITIKDVAKKANVSPSTVSRVMANSTKISSVTKRRVRKVMNELNYYPNLNARDLAKKTTKLIGIVMPIVQNKVIQDWFSSKLIRGINSITNTEGYRFCISITETEEEIFHEVKKMVEGRQIGGIILVFPNSNTKVIKYLCDKKFPFVLIGNSFEEKNKITFVNNDNYTAAKEMTEYFISLGHRDFAFIGDSFNSYATKTYLAGIRETMKLADILLSEEYVLLDCDPSRKNYQQIVEKLMALKIPPTVVITTNDLNGIGILSALVEKGFCVPKEVAIASFNNTFLSEILNPQLTVVDTNAEQLGYEAAKALIEKMKKPGIIAKSIIVPHKLLKRQTCSSSL